MLNSNCSTNRKVVKIENKIIGCLEGNKFIKSVLGSKHQLKYPPAWAIDSNAFDTEIKPNATAMVVIDKEKDIKYFVSTDSFDRLKGTLDRGFGRQYFLTLNYWQVEENGNRQLSLWGDNFYAHH